MFRCTQLALGVHVIWEPLGRPRDLDDLVSLVPWVSRHLGRITPTDRERNDAFFSAQEAHGLRETVWIETPAGGMDVRVPLPEPIRYSQPKRYWGPKLQPTPQDAAGARL